MLRAIWDDGPAIIDVFVAPDEMPNLPHLDMEQAHPLNRSPNNTLKMSGKTFGRQFIPDHERPLRAKSGPSPKIARDGQIGRLATRLDLGSCRLARAAQCFGIRVESVKHGQKSQAYKAFGVAPAALIEAPGARVCGNRPATCRAA
jgi:hypothetical protein